ncbi:hypothetical protein [Phormidium tenue]|uniref:hypothetical protein n=1 Tax=Phormidium tenue TaxID=126344 RepID=UPI0011153554|nr:hypothetical protein [Phormidium tenue]MBD2231746.1 hypothetical protein [Phormidium tenue FACHB-1052]
MLIGTSTARISVEVEKDGDRPSTAAQSSKRKIQSEKSLGTGISSILDSRVISAAAYWCGGDPIAALYRASWQFRRRWRTSHYNHRCVLP